LAEKAYRIGGTAEILTPEVVRSIRVIFDVLKLPVEIHSKLDSGPWHPMGGDAADEDEVPSGKRFCELLRSKVCSSAYDSGSCSSAFCKSAMSSLGKGGAVSWYCPCGMKVLGKGFRFGDASIVLQTTPWVERGSEGLPVRRVAELCPSLPAADRDQIIDELRRVPMRTASEVRLASSSLEELLKLVHQQVEGVYRRKIDASRKSFLDVLRKSSRSLGEDKSLWERRQAVGKQLDRICNFANLSGCALYFTAPLDAEELVLLSASADVPESCQSRIKRSSLAAVGAAPEVGLSVPFPARTSDAIDLSGLGERNSWYRGSVTGYPGGKTAVMFAWQEHGAPLPVAAELDDELICEACRVLSRPVYESAVMSELKREADLRRLQAKNSAHTVRSTFQVIAGDLDDLRGSLADGQVNMPPDTEDALERLEEQVGKIGTFLTNFEVIELRNPGNAQPFVLGKLRPVNIWETLENTVRSFRKAASVLRIDIVVAEEIRELPLVKADPIALSLILDNLVQNALKYSHRGGADELRSVVIRGREDRGRVHVEIEDFGLGIHPDEEDEIFKPYVRGTVEDQLRPISGQGIGLAAARDLARMLGGEVSLKTCVAYDQQWGIVPREEIERHPPSSDEAASLLQHCLVVMELALPATR